MLWLDRLSSSTTSEALLPELLLEEELLELLDEELELEELEELLLDDELEELLELEEELLLDEELDEELELLLDEDELELLDEELDEDELELLDELLEVSEPVQVGPVKLPSCVPWKPKPVLWPGFKACQLQQLVAVTVVVLPPDKVTFQLPLTFAGSAKPSVTVQPLIAVVPLLVTVTSTWYDVAWLLATVAVHV